MNDEIARQLRDLGVLEPLKPVAAEARKGYLIEIDVPEAVWKARKELEVSKLAASWSAIPA